MFIYFLFPPSLKQIMDAKIYRVVDGITTLDFLPAGGSRDDSVAAQFLRSKYADSVEETYLSKQNNEERKNFNHGTVAWFQGTTQPPHKSQSTPLQATELAWMSFRLRPRERRNQKLRGPFNPLEMKVFAKAKSLLGKSIRVEENSVNSVLLDDQPGDAHERILVASTVSLVNFNIY